MLDQACNDASRINRPPSSSLRPFLCSEDATGWTVGTVKMDKAHPWRCSSRKCRFPAADPEQHLYRTGVLASGAHHTSARCWEQTQDFTELLHVQAPQRAMAKHRECVYQPAEESAVVSIPIQSTNMWLMGKCIFYVKTNGFSTTNLHKYTGKQITCHKSTCY